MYMIKLKEYLLDKIQDSYIFKMASSRKDMKRLVGDLTSEIIENLSLIIYCQLFDKNNINKNHWKNELSSYLNKIFKMKLKGGDSKVKHKLISEVFFKEYELYSTEKISLWITPKFEQEGIETDLYNISRLCNIYLKNIIDFISCDFNANNFVKLNNYLKEL